MELSDERFHIVYYCTGHGLGHLSRTLEIIRHLVAAGHSVTVVTGAPVQVFAHDLPPQGLTVRHAILDTGAKQRDAFTVDQKGSLEEYLATAGGPRRSEILVQETSWLRETAADLVVSDVVPLACVCAAAAGLPCIAVSNFSWDFIYSEYLTSAGSIFKDLVWQIADDYACALRLLRLPGHCPMPAFREVLDVPLVVRHARRSRQEVRQALELPQDAKIVCFIYGGQPPGADWRLEASCLPEGWLCMVCSAGKPPGGSPLPHNFKLAPEDIYTPDMIAACDVVLGKIGYGTTSECLAHKRPLVFLRRDFFNEEPFLRKLLELNNSAVEMKRRDFLAGNWAPYLEAAMALQPCYSEPTNGAAVVAAELISTARDFKAGGQQQLPFGLSLPLSPTGSINGMDNSMAVTPRSIGSSSRPGSAAAGAHPSLGTAISGSGGVDSVDNNGNGGSSSTPRFYRPGQSRLRDTIAWGYMMGRHASRDPEDVPEWYTLGQIPYSASDTYSSSFGVEGAGAGTGAGPTTASTTAAGGVLGSDVEGMFEVLSGPESNTTNASASIRLDHFPDTLRFLSLLGSLEDLSATATSATKASSDASPSHSPRSLGASVEQHLVLPELRAAAGLFHRHDPLIISRAPGRLDVMGGIADYSGSTVLQMPIAEAAHVALQLQSPRHQRLWRHMQPRHTGTTTTATTTASASAVSSMLTSAPSSSSGSPTRAPSSSAAAAAAAGAEGGAHHQPPAPALRIVSLNADATNRGPAFDMDLSELLVTKTNPDDGSIDSIEPISYKAAREYFQRDPALSWAAYVAGALVVLMREKGVRPQEGIAMLVSSEVPEGKGVSSSAAIEVAAMSALAAAHGVHLEGREMALLCQKVENLVVGAPCGVMDQMASALGEAGWLLALKCQPAEVEGAVHIPTHLRFWGIDSGIRHSVGGSDYGAVRVGAFMGLKILSSSSSTSSKAIATKGVLLGDGYLANIPPSRFASRGFDKKLPKKIAGAEFLEKYGPHLDTATAVDREKVYAVRTPTTHPIFENFRVLAFRQALAAEGTSPRQQLELLGELMMQSHASYSACGLGSEGTDRLVALVLEEKAAAEATGREPALYGAKITGGGCGGTVCVLGTANEAGEAAVRRVIERYEATTGHCPQIFAGTSQGAVQFGTVKVQRRKGKETA